MGWWSRHIGEGKEIHKWQYINLSDFRTSSCPTVFSYIWLWGLTATSIAVYAVDTFTAVNLLAFNKWTSEVQPVINFNITKWIFVGCILFSWTLCIYEWIRAIRVMKQESVTEDFLDPLAVVLQSIRIPGGWRRFLVFAELTKSNKKATWVAVYVYFERKGALRVLAAEGPRNVLNAFTIYSVARADLIDIGGTKSDSFIGQFFRNIKTLFQNKQREGIVLFSMTFTFIIWFFSMLMLLLALFLWLFYISHHVDKETLTGYCRRKVETKLSKIIKDKTDKIWAKEEAEREKAARKKGIKPDDDSFDTSKRQPTLPVFATSPPKSSGSYMSRNESVATLPRYTSQPGTPGENELPPMPSQYSGQSSLLGNTAPMGQSYPISRPDTAASNRTFGAQRGPFMPPMNNNDSYNSYGTPRGDSPSSSFESSRRHSPPSSANGAPWRNNGSQYDDDHQEYEMQQPTPPGMRPGTNRNVSAPLSDRNQMPYPQMRNFTAPPGSMGGPPRMDNGANLPRSMTPGYGANLPPSMMPGGGGIPRSMTPGVPSGRSHTPGASSISSQSSGMHPSYRGQHQTPGPGSIRSQMSGPPSYRTNTPGPRTNTPGSRTNQSNQSDNPRSGGGPPAPGMAF